MSLGIFGHFFYIGLIKIAAVLNGNALFFARTLVFGSHIQNAVSINIKRHFNLRYAAWGRWNAVQNETTQRFIVAHHFALTLYHMNFYLRLVICGCAKCLTLAGRDRSVALNQL